VLDQDILALDDVCTLADYASRHFQARPDAALMYAHEQTSHYHDSLSDLVYAMSANPSVGRGGGVGIGGALPSVLPGWRFGFNGGVGVQCVRRLRRLGTYQGILKRVREAVAALPPAQLRLIIPVDDQTTFTLAAGWHAAQWAALMIPLPCEWNYQLCVGWYQDLVKGRPRHTADATCYEAPRLLHANSMMKGMVQALHHTRMPADPNNVVVSGSAGVAGARHGREKIRSAMVVDLHRHQSFQMKVCERASIAIPTLGARYCNISFLLQRLEAGDTDGMKLV